MKRYLILSIIFLFYWSSEIKAQSSVDNYLKVEHDHFVLYAPDEMELKIGKSKLLHSVDQFSKYFSNNPPQISVLLTDDPFEIQSIDDSKFKGDTKHFLPFVTQSSFASSTQTAPKVFSLNMGAIIMENEAGISIIAVIDNINEKNVDLRAMDQISSINGQYVNTLDEFKEVYAAINATEKVNIGVNRNGISIDITYYKPIGEDLPSIEAFTSSRGTSRIENSDLSDRRPLTHEACHGFFMTYVEREYPDASKNTQKNSYGSDAMPDWLDEAAATLCEVPEFQNSRIQFLEERLEKRYSLNELFSMNHPLDDLITSSRSGNGTQILRLESGDMVTSKLGLFYSQVLSVSQFLIEKAGVEVMNDITRHYAYSDGGMATFLNSNESLPNSIQELEEKWLNWLSRS